MNIALIAHDKKKELMVQFCIAYKGILQKHNLIATDATGNFVSEATGLQVEKMLAGSGGVQQIGARIAYNEIDAVLFFRDPFADNVRFTLRLRVIALHAFASFPRFPDYKLPPCSCQSKMFLNRLQIKR